jgi:hypothetical protein
MGSGNKFDKAIAAFAAAYADQTTADHKLLLAAIRSGRLKPRSASGRKMH